MGVMAATNTAVEARMAALGRVNSLLPAGQSVFAYDATLGEIGSASGCVGRGEQAIKVAAILIGLNRPALGGTVPKSIYYVPPSRFTNLLSRFRQPSSFGRDFPHSNVKCLVSPPRSFRAIIQLLSFKIK